MMDDPRAAAFADSFPAAMAATAASGNVRARPQALSGLRRLSRKKHDRGDDLVFPRSHAAQSEPSEFLDSDWTMLNDGWPSIMASPAFMARRCSASRLSRRIIAASRLRINAPGANHGPAHNEPTFKTPAEPSPKPTAISLFAGAGGCSLGFQQAGYNVQFATDLDHDAVESYRRNFPGTPCEAADVRDLGPDALLEKAGVARANSTFCSAVLRARGSAARA